MSQLSTHLQNAKQLQPLYGVTRKYVLRKIVRESMLIPVSPALKERDCLYVLNATGYELYAHIHTAGTCRADDLKAHLLSHFVCQDEEQVTADVKNTLTQLLEIEAITESPAHP